MGSGTAGAKAKGRAGIKGQSKKYLEKAKEHSVLFYFS